jgi:hypothetical protein
MFIVGPECRFPGIISEVEDARKTGLKNGLRQLTFEQLQRVIDYPGEMILDEFNYKDGKFCPLAIGIGLDQIMTADPTHEKVFITLTEMGYKVYNTLGIAGEFYTTNRKQDLLEAAKEVLEEKRCPCLAVNKHCGPCGGGYHIFCNNVPHGDFEEAHQWFLDNPEITKEIIVRDPELEQERMIALEENNKKKHADDQ